MENDLGDDLRRLNRLDRLDSLDGNDSLEGLEVFARTVRSFAHLNLSPIQARVLRELLDGDRTVAELVLSIYNLDYKDDEYRTHQSRVRRAIKKLESSGFVSKKKLLGREKPYGITVYGAERIASIIPDTTQPVLLTRWDYALYAVTTGMGAVAWLALSPILVNLFSLLLGMSLIRSIYLLKRVI